MFRRMRNRYRAGIPAFAPQRQMEIGFNSTRASHSWCRCRKRNYAMSIKRLFDAVERRDDIGRRVAALVFPISNRPRVTSRSAGKIGLREPGEHTSGPNLASRDNVAHYQTLIYDIYDSGNAATGPSRFVESRPGHTLSCLVSCVMVPGVALRLSCVTYCHIRIKLAATSTDEPTFLTTLIELSV
jgi:hypothetical protein